MKGPLYAGMHYAGGHAGLISVSDREGMEVYLRNSSGKPFQDCTCYRDCRQDSLSGTWHQHEDEPCPVHPDAPVVG